ncbi:MAG: FAD-dependent oxidoreductase [Candidatus Omnitrophota bacterium]
MKKDIIILGAGITGLSAGLSTGAQIYEAGSMPGGICASYYIGRDGKKSSARIDDETYRFEVGGGHWMFGADKNILDFLEGFCDLNRYDRISSVYLPDRVLYVPYPIQNHLSYLSPDIRDKVLAEIIDSDNTIVKTLRDWLEMNFGRTLSELFFFPFHKLYTADMYARIAPQDSFKTPVDRELLMKGARERTPAVGYNASFFYPQNGLDGLINNMAAKCRINYNKRALKIFLDKKEILFEDGERLEYETIISTLPLNQLLEMTGLLAGSPDPFTSVLVVNIGAKKGERCPRDHWLYIPESKAGFHRVGFYSNVDPSFLPASSRKDNSRVSIYVEKAYLPGLRPAEDQVRVLCRDIVDELTDWKFIAEAEVVDPTWIETGYTWQYPGSEWKQKALTMLEKYGIRSTGRYGKWKFQGIAESLKDGIDIKTVLNG